MSQAAQRTVLYIGGEGGCRSVFYLMHAAKPVKKWGGLFIRVRRV